MGIVLRSRDPYAGVVETTLARFGIPARFYFHRPLGSHPALMYFSTVIQAVLAGWEHATLLAAVRMPVSGLGATAAGDQLDFAWRDRLPDFGLPLPAGLEQLAALDRWSRDRLEPREWAARLKTLRALLPAPRVMEDADRDRIGAMRSTSAALAAFEEILDGAAIALEGSRPVRSRCFLEASGNRPGARAFARAGCAAERGPRHGRLRSAPVGTPGGVRMRADRAAFPAVSSRGSDPGRRGAFPGGSGYGCRPARRKSDFYSSWRSRGRRKRPSSVIRASMSRGKILCRRFFWKMTLRRSRRG